MAKDPQRFKVYRWEESEFLREEKGKFNEFSLDQCQKIINKYVYKFGLYPIKITHRSNRKQACCYYTGRKIDLPLWARNKLVILHEFTHALMIQKFGRKYADHGPEFVRIHIDLLSKELKISIKELKKNAKEKGIKISSKSYDELLLLLLEVNRRYKETLAVPYPVTLRVIKIEFLSPKKIILRI